MARLKPFNPYDPDTISEIVKAVDKRATPQDLDRTALAKDLGRAYEAYQYIHKHRRPPDPSISRVIAIDPTIIADYYRLYQPALMIMHLPSREGRWT